MNATELRETSHVPAQQLKPILLLDIGIIATLMDTFSTYR